MGELKNEVIWWFKAVSHIVMGIVFFIPFIISMYFVSKENHL